LVKIAFIPADSGDRQRLPVWDQPKFWFQDPVSNPIDDEDQEEKRRPAEREERDEPQQEDPVEVNGIRSVLFERSLERQKFEQNL